MIAKLAILATRYRKHKPGKFFQLIVINSFYPYICLIEQYRNIYGG